MQKKLRELLSDIILHIFFIGLGFDLLINGKFLLSKFFGAVSIIFFGGLLLYWTYKNIKSDKS